VCSVVIRFICESDCCADARHACFILLAALELSRLCCWVSAQDRLGEPRCAKDAGSAENACEDSE
jgi:hypothetical protein